MFRIKHIKPVWVYKDLLETISLDDISNGRFVLSKAIEKGERKIFPERNFRKMRSDGKIFKDGKINVCT